MLSTQGELVPLLFSTKFSVMKESDFTNRLNYIIEIEKQLGSLRENLSSKYDFLSARIKESVRSSRERDNSFKRYIQEIKKLSFETSDLEASKLVAPTSLFNGLSPSLNKIDFDKLKEVSANMEDEASEIESQNDTFELHKMESLKDLKALLNEYIEFIKQEDLLYNEELKLLRDLDSPYDIGGFSSKSKSLQNQNLEF